MCNIREIDGLVAIVSVIRPGAANEGKKLSFTRRYQCMEPIEYVPLPCGGHCHGHSQKPYTCEARQIPGFWHNKVNK